MSDPFIQLQNITKRFGGVLALSDVTLNIARGEVHGLMGENGAGKSTLGKVLAGIHRPDEGRIVIDGVAHDFHSPAHALQAGVGMVHQELAFCPDLSVAENLCMGVYPRRLGMVDRAAMRRRAETLLAQVGLSLDVRRPMRTLTTGQEQAVQIAAAVGTNARIIVFDEPTASLSNRESDQLFALMADLKARGITMIYVSHRLPEVLSLCDRITVLRDGKYVGTMDRAEASQDALVKMMTGRVIAERQRSVKIVAGTPRLRVSNLASPGKFRGINFSVRGGEIVGMAGLVGAGRSEIATAIFGLDPAATGSVEIDGDSVRLYDIHASMRAGIALVPEDRKRQGLVLEMSCRANTSMAILPRLKRLLMLDRGRERAIALDMTERLRIKTASVDAAASSLSGGNQQKIVIAKWLARDAKVLIVDEPTRGVDVGAKQAIHDLIEELAATGAAVLVISSELPEVLALSDRILVMREGDLVAEVPRKDANEQTLLSHMAGVTKTAA